MEDDSEQASSDAPDDAIPSLDRQAELEAAYQQNVAEGKTPYQDVAIRTLGELHWVMAARAWPSTTNPPSGKVIANLSNADLSGANLSDVSLKGANLSNAILSGTNLSGANLYRVNLSEAEIVDVNLHGATLTFATLSGAFLLNTDLSGARMEFTNLFHANLVNANLRDTTLRFSTLSGATLRRADLSGANLRGVRFDATAQLTWVKLDSSVRLADVVWNDVPLTRVDWEAAPKLGDEVEAEQPTGKGGKRKDKATRLNDYTTAARSYRQLAVAVRSQGMNEPADNYAYRAQLMQRVVLRRQAFLPRQDGSVKLRYSVRKLAAYVGSLILDAIAGYGYKPGRSFATYLIVVGGFAVLYYALGGNVHPALTIHDAIVFSITSFHGRGFSPGENITLHNPLTTWAAIEAIIGLLIEITFIATFTQRFFAR